MKTIGVMYGTTANKFWGVCGLIMHSAICNASHQTVQYKGGIYSQLSGVSRWVSVRHEDRSLSLVAKLSEASFSKFLSHSFNANIKKSNLKGFFTLNPSHAQSVVGMTGLLKGRLASLGLSISKYHFFSLNLHFSLLTKTRGVKPNLMLKRISAERQSHLAESAISFEDYLEKIMNSPSFENEIIREIEQSNRDVDLLFRDIFEEDIPEINQICDETESLQEEVFTTINSFCQRVNTVVQNMSNFYNSLQQSILKDNNLNKCVSEVLDRNRVLEQYYDSIKETANKLDEEIEKFQFQQNEVIEAVKNKFTEINDPLHDRFHTSFSNTFNQLFEFLKDEHVECISEQLWMTSNSKHKLEGALKDLDGEIQYEGKLSELEHELCQLWEACLDIENNQCSLKEKMNSYITLITSVKTFRNKIDLGAAQKILFEKEDSEIPVKIDKLSKRVEIFLDIASRIIFEGIKEHHQLKVKILLGNWIKLEEKASQEQAEIENVIELWKKKNGLTFNLQSEKMLSMGKCKDAINIEADARIEQGNSAEQNFSKTLYKLFRF